MPKTYSQKEREYIRKRLKEAAAECLDIYGVKRTTVDELVQRANIPKGTFYLFYESKELLLFDVVNDFHDEIQKTLLKELESFGGNIQTQQLSDLLFRIYKKAEDSFLISLMKNNDMELLMRKLPDEAVAQHMSSDNKAMEILLSHIPKAEGRDMEVFSAAMRGIFLMMMNRREIGEHVFDDALKLLINGLAAQLMEG